MANVTASNRPTSNARFETGRALRVATMRSRWSFVRLSNTRRTTPASTNDRITNPSAESANRGRSTAPGVTEAAWMNPALT